MAKSGGGIGVDPGGGGRVQNRKKRTVVTRPLKTNLVADSA